MIVTDKKRIHSLLDSGEATWPIFVCVLGNFRLLKAGHVITLRHGGKTETLLRYLGIRNGLSIPRDRLLNLLWPSIDAELAIQSLHSLAHSLRVLVGDAIGDAALVLHDEGSYRLNTEAGVGVDLACFSALMDMGDQEIRAGKMSAALHAYDCAVGLYRGDLCDDGEVETILEREHLRARFLTLLAQLADQDFARHDYTACLGHSWRLLAQDPCREDAHRMVMRCHVRRGERAEALRHFQVCSVALRFQFDVEPEPATIALYERIRLDPANV